MPKKHFYSKIILTFYDKDYYMYRKEDDITCQKKRIIKSLVMLVSLLGTHAISSMSLFGMYQPQYKKH